jgi:hypothetical protein
LCEPLEACGRLLNRADVFVNNDLWRGRGTDNFREPSQVGRATWGPAGGADIVAEQKGFETACGVFELTAGIFTSPGERAHGFILDLGDIDRREIACASEASQWHSVSTVRFDPISGLSGQE